MRRTGSGALIISAWMVVGMPVQARVPGWIERLTVWATPELQALDHEKEQLGGELDTLPVPARVNSGVRRGYQTGRVDENEEPWVEVRLSQAREADSVVLVPMLGKGAKGLVPGYGFPVGFILEGWDDQGEIHVLMEESTADFPNPGYYPVRALCPPGVRLERVRLTATEPWNENGREVLALAEMLVISGNRNLATNEKVTYSSSRNKGPTWLASNLVDMAMPLGLPVLPSPGAKLGWRSEAGESESDRKLLVVDLGESFMLDEIQLAPAWRPGMSSSFNLGFPALFGVITSNDEDFRKQELVLDETEKSRGVPGQNLVCVPLDGSPVRYISVVATRLRDHAGEYFFSLGELRAYEGDRNVALGAKVISSESVEDDDWGAEGLTDGQAGAGRLIELDEWFTGLERRSEVEARLDEIGLRRNELMAQGEHFLINGSIGTTVCLAVGAVFIGYRGKRQRRLDRERHRERLARDLHDELGSNLGSIALMSSFALEGESDEKQMRGDMAEIELVARESADSMRDLVELLGGKHRGAGSDWLSVLDGMAERLLRGVELDCDLSAGPWKHLPDLESRREIYLFCKEALHNITRHAKASHVKFLIKPTESGLWVEIRDNGQGFDPSMDSDGHGLGNLRARAADLHGTLDLVSTPGEGTVITLDVPRGRRWRKQKDS